MIKIYLDRVQ